MLGGLAGQIDMRFLRMFRLLRVLKLIRYSAAFYILVQVFKENGRSPSEILGFKQNRLKTGNPEHACPHCGQYQLTYGGNYLTIVGDSFFSVRNIIKVPH